MDKINFQPIFDYIDQSQSTLKEELLAQVATKKDLKKLQDSVDAIAKGQKDNNEKVVVLQSKSEHVEKWVIQAAEKIKLPYKA